MSACARSSASPPRSWSDAEYLDVDAQGRLYTGTLDGRLLRLEADGSGVVELARTGGRPIGLRVLRDGTLIVADGARGLLRVTPDGVVEVLASGHDGLPFGLTDDVAVSADERHAWFTDASNRHGVDDHLDDILEHGGRGRLLRIDLATRETTLLRDGLEFANGVVLGPGEQYLLVCETGSYRVLRHWLAGPRAGETEAFADNLPGFPDNITYNGRDRYWVALANPRNAALDRLGPYPRLREVVARLPPFLRPQPVRHGYVVAARPRGPRGRCAAVRGRRCLCADHHRARGRRLALPRQPRPAGHRAPAPAALSRPGCAARPGRRSGGAATRAP